MKFFKDKYFYRTFFALSSVIILQNLLTFGVNLADNIMLGKYSEVAMSGVSLANQVQFLLQMFAMGAANGVGVLAAQYWGKGDTKPIKKIFTSAAIIATSLSALLGLAVIAVPESVLGLLTNKTNEIAAEVKIFLMGLVSPLPQYCAASTPTPFAAPIANI